MRKYVKEFCKRGMMFAWGGPVIVAIVLWCIERAGALGTLTAGEILLAVVSSTVLAFVAAGVSIVYQIDKLPVGIAALIQLAVLYVDYLVVYLINGWLAPSSVLWFTFIFAGCFAVIWAAIYCIERGKVKHMNQKLTNLR